MSSVDIPQMMKMVEESAGEWFYEHITGHEVKYENKNWNLRKLRPDGSYGGIWVQFNKDNHVTILNRYRVDLYDFQVYLFNTLLSESVYHKVKYEGLVEVLGEKEVNDAYEGMKNFVDDIKNVIIDVDRKKNIKLLFNND